MFKLSFKIFIQNLFNGNLFKNFSVEKYSNSVLPNENNSKEKKDTPKKKISVDDLLSIKDCEKKLGKIFGSKVKLKGNLNCGKITINYISYDFLDELYKKPGYQRG